MRLSLLITSFLIGVFFMTSAAGEEFTITSDGFRNKGPIPEQYTCDGNNDSPALKFNGIPANTKSLALIVSDPDAPAGTWYHWVIYNMPATTTEIKMNEKPSGIVGKNSYNKTEYNGPCPPVGSLPHRYVFTLYALNSELKFPVTADARSVENALQKRTLKSTQITGVYKRK